jgi:hypothetical protein
MTLTGTHYNFAPNCNNELKINRMAAKILCSLRAEIVSIPNTNTRPPLADTADLLSEVQE